MPRKWGEKSYKNKGACQFIELPGPVEVWGILDYPFNTKRKVDVKKHHTFIWLLDFVGNIYLTWLGFDIIA